MRQATIKQNSLLRTHAYRASLKKELSFAQLQRQYKNNSIHHLHIGEEWKKDFQKKIR